LRGFARRTRMPVPDCDGLYERRFGQELLNEGALAIVEKPLDLTALTEKIGGILGRRRGAWLTRGRA